MSMEEKKETPLKAAFTWDELKLNSDGMVCVVVQDDKNKDVLMVAYMNRQAYEKTLETGVRSEERAAVETSFGSKGLPADIFSMSGHCIWIVITIRSWQGWIRSVQPAIPEAVAAFLKKL